MQLVAEYLLLLVVLLTLTEICNRSKWGGWIVIVGLGALVTSSTIVLESDLHIFTWIKLYTLAFSALWVHLLRFHEACGKRVMFTGMWFILALNIIEAGVMDLVVGHYANGLCALVLVASLTSYRAMNVEGIDRHLSWPIPISWIVAYTLWNFTFVSGKYGWHLTDHLIVLGIPLGYLALRPSMWMQARGYSLTIYVFVLITWVQAFQGYWPPNILSDEVQYGAPKHDDLRAVLTIGVCVVVLIHVAIRLRLVMKNKAHVVTERART